MGDVMRYHARNTYHASEESTRFAAHHRRLADVQALSVWRTHRARRSQISCGHTAGLVGRHIPLCSIWPALTLRLQYVQQQNSSASEGGWVPDCCRYGYWCAIVLVNLLRLFTRRILRCRTKQSGCARLSMAIFVALLLQ